MKSRRGAFTLIELLIVIAIIGVLAGFLLPALVGAKEKAKSAFCVNNIHQLITATLLYCNSNDEYYPPSSWDLMTTNLQRWHGARSTQSQPFDFKRSPLKPYLQVDRIKACPTFEQYLTGFEAGCGGYGYNDDYVGSGRGDPSDGSSRPARRGMISDPVNTVLFADCAFLGGAGKGVPMEYSFITEPLFECWGNCPSVPSVHFRHHGLANVGWCDGHVTSEPLGWTRAGETCGGFDFGPSQIGYIGQWQDNRLYDRK